MWRCCLWHSVSRCERTIRVEGNFNLFFLCRYSRGKIKHNSEQNASRKYVASNINRPIIVVSLENLIDEWLSCNLFSAIVRSSYLGNISHFRASQSNISARFTFRIFFSPSLSLSHFLFNVTSENIKFCFRAAWIILKIWKKIATKICIGYVRKFEIYCNLLPRKIRTKNFLE